MEKEEALEDVVSSGFSKQVRMLPLYPTREYGASERCTGGSHQELV